MMRLFPFSCFLFSFFPFFLFVPFVFFFSFVFLFPFFPFVFLFPFSFFMFFVFLYFPLLFFFFFFFLFLMAPLTPPAARRCGSTRRPARGRRSQTPCAFPSAGHPPAPHCAPAAPTRKRNIKKINK